jgi:serine/threonine protein kinase
LDGDDNLKISDFGLSGIANTNSMLSTICGTPHYVSPEVLTGKYEGKKSDIWSCGIILFVMLSGCHPFDGETVNDLFKRIENLEFKYPTYFSSGARALLDKIIVIDPEHRASIDDIERDEWFTEGMDLDQIVTRKGSKISVAEDDEYDKDADIIITKEDMENAVQDINDGNDPQDQGTEATNVASVSDFQNAVGKRQRQPRRINIDRSALADRRMSLRMQNTEKITAFDIIAILVSHSLKNLISPPDKKEKKKADKSNTTIKRNCTFIAVGHPDDVFDQISKFIQAMKYTEVKLSDTSFELKVKYRGDVEFGFKMSVLQTFGTNLCEMHRVKGNTLKFHELFRLLNETFGTKDIPPASDASPTAETVEQQDDDLQIVTDSSQIVIE